MTFRFWKKGTKEEVKNALSEVDIEKAIISVDGVDVPLKELIDTYKAEEAEKSKKDELTKENISEDTIVEIDGKETPIKNLVESYRSKQERVKNEEKTPVEEKKEDAPLEDDKKIEQKNEDPEKKEEVKPEEIKKENEMKCSECGVMKNSKEEPCKPCEDKKTLENSNSKHFENLKKAADLRGEPQSIHVTTQKDRLEEGRRKYGTTN